MVSAPSVVLSATTFTVTVALPLASVVTRRSRSPVTSPACTPSILTAYSVLAAPLVMLNVTAEPSSTLAALAAIANTGAGATEVSLTVV